MVYEQVKELMTAFDNSSIVNFYLELDKSVLKMKKKSVAKDSDVDSSNVDVSVVPSVNDDNDGDTLALDTFELIKSPIVGTFYSSPQPDSDSYVSVGSVVKKGDIVCIIEAMKIMNEITSSFDGTVVEVLVENGCAVEYGQPLFKVCNA